MQIDNLPCFWRSLPTECYGGYKHLLLHFEKRSHALTKTRTCVSESQLYNYLNWWRPAVCLWMKESNPLCRRIPKHNMRYSSSLPCLLSCYRKQNSGISEAQTLSGNPIQTSAVVSTTILEMHSIEVRRSTICTPKMGSKSALSLKINEKPDPRFEDDHHQWTKPQVVDWYKIGLKNQQPFRTYWTSY